MCDRVTKQNVLSRTLTKLSMLMHGVCGWEEHEDGLDVEVSLSFSERMSKNIDVYKRERQSDRDR